MAKERLDILVVERGLVESREQAQRLILAGLVSSKGHVLSKPGHRFDVEVPLELKSTPPFVSRGGEKLEGAFKAFDLNVNDLVCLDVGASTGGFTDCLLQHGAGRVFAVDVGKGQLHWKLREDERVVVIEGVNARYLRSGDLPEVPAFVVVDVSFISLTVILPAVVEVILPGTQIVTLIKPQFEAGREQIEKGGVVKDPAIRVDVVERIKSFGENELGLKWKGVVESPLKGPAGNVEFLAWWIMGQGVAKVTL